MPRDTAGTSRVGLHLQLADLPAYALGKSLDASWGERLLTKWVA